MDLHGILCRMYLTQGIIMGLYAAAMPGPLQFFMLSQTLRIGWRRTLPAALAPLMSDGPIMLLFLVVLSRAPEWFLNGLRIGGGLFLLYLAWGAIQTYRAGPSTDAPPDEGARTSFFKAGTMNLFNPNVYIFWATIGAPMVLEGLKRSTWGGLSFIVGMYGTMIPAMAGIIVLFGAGGKLKPSARRYVGGALALLLLGIGLYQIGTGVRAFIA